MIKQYISIHAYIDYLLFRLVQQSKINTVVNMYLFNNKWNWLLGNFYNDTTTIHIKLENFYNEFLKYHQIYGTSYENTELFLDIWYFLFSINLYMLNNKYFDSSFLYENINNLQDIRWFTSINFLKYYNDYINFNQYKMIGRNRKITVYLYIHFLLRLLIPHYKLHHMENEYAINNEWTRMIYDRSRFKGNKSLSEELQEFLQEFIYYYNLSNDSLKTGDIYYYICLYIFTIKNYILKYNLDKSFFMIEIKDLKNKEEFINIEFFLYENDCIDFYK